MEARVVFPNPGGPLKRMRLRTSPRPRAAPPAAAQIQAPEAVSSLEVARDGAQLAARGGGGGVGCGQLGGPQGKAEGGEWRGLWAGRRARNGAGSDGDQQLGSCAPPDSVPGCCLGVAGTWCRRAWSELRRGSGARGDSRNGCGACVRVRGRELTSVWVCAGEN